jgi:predicted S18 family serine protease
VQLSQNKPPLSVPQSTQDELPSSPTARISLSPEQLGESTKLEGLIVSLKETIIQQNIIIESFRADLTSIKAEQQYLKSQNTELQETIKSLRS